MSEIRDVLAPLKNSTIGSHGPVTKKGLHSVIFYVDSIYSIFSPGPGEPGAFWGTFSPPENVKIVYYMSNMVYVTYISTLHSMHIV